MNYLSIDCGVSNIGYSVYDYTTKKFLEIGDIRAKEKELNDKIKFNFQRFQQVFSTHKPEVLVYEEPVFIKGMGATGSKMSQVLGMIKTLAIIHNVSTIVGYTATQVKRVTTGNGKADKKEIEDAVCKHFNLHPSDFSSDHASDSCAILYTYLKN